MAYYDQKPQFEQTANTTQVYFATVLFPQSWLGFWSVMIVLAVHLGLVAVITLGFTLRSKHTLLGNYWQTVAQIIGPETQDLLADSRMATDKEVKNEVLASGSEDVRVGIGPLEGWRRAGLSTL